MKLYLAGPMTGIEQHNVPAFDAAADALRGLCFAVVSPPDITRANPLPGIHGDGSISQAAYQELVRLDLLELLDCDAVAVLPGWDRSKGARLEAAVAIATGMNIYTVESLLDDGMNARPLELVIMCAAGVQLPSARRPVNALPSFPYSVDEPDCAGGSTFDGDPARVVVGQGSL